MQSSPSLSSRVVKYSILLIIALWVLVVCRVLFLDKSPAVLVDSGNTAYPDRHPSEHFRGNDASSLQLIAVKAKKNISHWDHNSVLLPDPRYHSNTKVNRYLPNVRLARPPIKVSLGSNIGDNGVSNRLSRKEDYTIDISESYDVMPVTGLNVPKFWKPDPSLPIRDIGSKINGLETIFVMIASYRDFQCRETIASLFSRADHPERIFVGASDQLVDGDIGCSTLPKPCSENPEQALCKFKDQITVFKMDAKLATGPVTARHIGDRLYRGEYFVMQLDAHCEFVRHWDTNIIAQWRQTGNEMAVLTSYLSDVQGSVDKNGDSTRNTRPIMCNSAFEGEMPARYLRHGSQPEDSPVIRDMPQLEPFWAAGFSFSRGHFLVQVPYDGYQPMVFQGEEIGIGIRGFTYGYDYYAPQYSVVFHEYAVKSERRKKVHMYWENGDRHVGEAKKSLARGMSIIKMAPDIPDDKWDHSEMDRYGLGSVRPVELFYKLFLIDPAKRTSVQLCPFVRLGSMHRNFQKFLRSDGMGIDYNYLLNFDTDAALEEVLEKQRPGVTAQLKNALKNKNIDGLRSAITEAEKVRLDVKNPELYEEAKGSLKKLIDASNNRNTGRR